MKFKRIIAILLMFSLTMGMISSSFADTDDDSEDIEEVDTDEVDDSADFGSVAVEYHDFNETTEAKPKGPEVVEYYEYKDDKPIAPGSLSGDINLSTVGKGLYFDGTDYYFFLDTGVMATNYMITIEGNRFYFGDEGKMLKDQLVSYNGETYYFDANGAMFKNQWYTYEEIDPYDNTINYIDYYFGPTGRAYRAGDSSNGLVVKTIEDQKFGFNTDGEKLEGYYDASGNELKPSEEPAYESCVYYFDPGENGAAVVGWHYYEGSERGDEYDSNEEIVLYFDEKTCKKVAAKSNGNTERCVSRIIDGQRYMFDQNGVRKNKWYQTEPGRGTYSNAKFFSEEEDGYLQKGWFQAIPGSYNNWENELILEVNKTRHKNDEDVWFYAGSNGNVLKKTIRKIGNYVYAFDDDGVMQQDALVKVRSGSFIKAYETQYLYKANVLFDYKEYGGKCADPDPYGHSNPTELDKTTGILNSENKEQWMYFVGEGNTDTLVGTQCKLNQPVKIELNDDDVYFICNSAGGYGIYSEPEPGILSGVTELAEVVERNNKLIQNGVLLKPNGDDNNYGLVRTKVAKQTYATDNARINAYNYPLYATNSSIPYGEKFSYKVVNSTGNVVTFKNKCIKDKSGYYLYFGPDEGELIGVYNCQGQYVEKAPDTIEDPNDKTCFITKEGRPCWKFKRDGEKEWTYGLPPIEERVDADYLFLNFSKDSNLSKGPYVDGIASDMYEDVHWEK